MAKYLQGPLVFQIDAASTTPFMWARADGDGKTVGLTYRVQPSCSTAYQDKKMSLKFNPGDGERSWMCQSSFIVQAPALCYVHK